MDIQTNRPSSHAGIAYHNPCAVSARIAAAAVIAAAVTVIAGYAIHANAVIWLKPGLTGMSLVTAASLFLLGVAVSFQHHAKRLAAILSSAVALLGVSVLGLYGLYGADTLSLRIDNSFGLTSVAAPQVSVATACCMTALGIALVLRAQARVADFLALTVMICSGFALLGYAYNVTELYAVPIFKSMALHTAASFLLLSVAAVLLRPTAQWCAVIGANTEAGALTRRQLSFMIFPLVGGAFFVRVIAAGAMGPATALAVWVVLTVTSLALLILRDGRRLAEIDEVRQSQALVSDRLRAQMIERLAEQEAEIARRSAEHALAQAALYRSQRLEALSRLTGSIAHDFNNLLQAIGGSLDLLPRRVSEGKPINALLDRAKSAIRRGAQLGSQLLAFSRTQKLDLRLHTLDDLLAQSKPIIATAVGSNIEVRYDLKAQEAWIMTDKDQFSLALLNLALNARDAMRGGGTLTVSTECKAAAFADRSDRAGVSIQVTDTGEGMLEEVQARAAEPFFSTKPEGTASGLGLSQVSSLMRQSQGELALRSQLTQGTTVELVFPARSASVTAVPPVIGSPEASRAQRPLIVVIEDDEAVRESLVGGLSSFGFGVADAKDGTSGIELLARVTPAVAVIDYLMPDLNGAQVARRARVAHPTLPIIFVSGHFETAALEAIPNATILRKPFELEELHARLTAILLRNGGEATCVEGVDHAGDIQTAITAALSSPLSQFASSDDREDG